MNELSTVRYFKRLRMEVDLRVMPLLESLPHQCIWIPWSSAALEQHAQVKHRAFMHELDATIFPSLSTALGCLELMKEIATAKTFSPEATWLVGEGLECLGTIQGVADRTGKGMIQNLAVVPEARGRGLGRLLMIKSLLGFKKVGVRKVFLEVTADNAAALRIYRRLGFRRRKSFYKAVEVL